MSETPQEYSQRMMGNVGKQDALKVQAATPRKLAALIRGRSAAKLRKRPATGKWSAAEIVAHLADCELVFAWRMRQIIGSYSQGVPGAARGLSPEDEVQTLQPFDQDSWAATMNYAKRDPRKSLETFRAVRQSNVALLKSLTPAQRKLYAMHPERSEESIEHIMRLVAGHDINHLRQIEAIVRGKG